MPAVSAEGIILRKYYLRETSLILVVFTREHGKVRGVLKGVRDPFPQFAGNFELFTRCDLVFYRKRKSAMDLITQCEALDFFLPLRKDIERLTYANYFIELIDVVTQDHDKKEGLYLALLESLRSLAGGMSPKRVARIFELKLLQDTGLTPELIRCVRCSNEPAENIYFSVAEGGLICGGCVNREDRAIRISKGTVNFMRKILSLPLERTGQIKVSRDVGREVEGILKKFLEFHVGRQMKSMKFLAEIEKKGVLV